MGSPSFQEVLNGWRIVTRSDRPLETGDEDVPTPKPGDGGRVIPFPRGGHGPLRRDDRDWMFTTEVRWVDGTEGEWLRHELVGVVRDLLAWAHDDMDGRHADERRAA